jgi:hypothetical protein
MAMFYTKSVLRLNSDGKWKKSVRGWSQQLVDLERSCYLAITVTLLLSLDSTAIPSLVGPMTTLYHLTALRAFRSFLSD